MAYSKTNWVNNTTLINETNLNKIENGIKNNDINIGEENYDNTKTYEVGDIVRYNEKIYKCITAITTAENFDISKWEQTNIVEIVQSEKSKIYELIEAISTPIVGEGEYITLNDTAEKRFENLDIEGNSEQEATPSPDYPSEVESCGDNGSINEVICNKNLFESPLIGYSIFGSVSEGYNVSKTTNGVTYIAKLKNNQNYYIKKNNNIGDRFRIVLFKDFPVPTTYSKDAIQITSDASLSEYGFNSDKYNYVVFTANVSSIYSGDCLAQLELGSIATPYQEHKEQTYTIPTQQPFRAIGDIRDTFIKKNNKWYERHYISRKIFDGTEDWTKNTTINNTFFTNKPQGMQANETRLMSNITNWFGTSYYNSKDCVIAGGNSFNIKNANISTVDNFKAWLTSQYNAGTPVYVDYVSDTPIDIECTEEQSTILFDIEQNAKTYKGVTHIYSNDAVSPNCYVEAAKDLTTLIQ